MLSKRRRSVELRPQAGRQEQFLSCPADVCVYGGEAGGGKALRLTTPIPTPSGWTTIGRLRVGDLVLSEFGKPIPVLVVHPILYGRPNFRVVFDDGSSIYACADHLWLTTLQSDLDRYPQRKYPPGVVRSTREIHASLFDDDLDRKPQHVILQRCLARDLPLSHRGGFRAKNAPSSLSYSRPVRRILNIYRAERDMAMRCITVDNASGLYLAGESYIPTHNTYGLLLEPLRSVKNPGFGAVIFRRTLKQIRNTGGMWDEATTMYPLLGGVPRVSEFQWRFPSRATIQFAHMQNEDDRFSWDGAQIPLIGFDQLESFGWKSWTYMLSRNRSTCGVRPYMRATCNPHPDHFLRSFMSWWIGEDGFPIEERSGIIRYFVLQDDVVHWGSSREELIARVGEKERPLSFTFIRARLKDNPALMEKDPGYESRLMAMPRIDRLRLLGGNWDVRETAGEFFRREWFPIVEAAPARLQMVRYWDRAATEIKAGESTRKASWTVGMSVGRSDQGEFFVMDVNRFQSTPLKVRQTILNCAISDGPRSCSWLEQDPGQAGKSEVEDVVRYLAGHNVRVNLVRERKGIRAKPASSQAEQGNIKIVRGRWTEDLLNELENFDGSDSCVSDQTDCLSGAVHVLTNRNRAGSWGN